MAAERAIVRNYNKDSSLLSATAAWDTHRHHTTYHHFICY
jgi:hypothetical protein